MCIYIHIKSYIYIFINYICKKNCTYTHTHYITLSHFKSENCEYDSLYTYTAYRRNIVYDKIMNIHVHVTCICIVAYTHLNSNFIHEMQYMWYILTI